MTRAPSKRTLAIPLIVFALAALAAAGAVKYSADAVAAARQKLGAQQSQLRDAQARLQKSGSEKELISHHLPQYQQLARIGFVGEEQRINWLDALRTVNHNGDLFGIDYDISPRRPLPPGSALATTLAQGQMQVMQSVMKLRFPLLHEEDLPRFFDLLSKQQVGFFIVDRCLIRRGALTTRLRYQPTLLADCQLSWLTTQPAAAAPENKP
jgi:hypothetical protein